ncbi:MAG: dynamin family protein [Bacteroidales bacterium]|nr:dynamin family protein [Bacteroidales bacterium]
MEQNLFEELQAKKQQLISMAQKAAEYGWIDANRKKEIIDKINNDVLTIGVIGQMKCGKSTFLNSFVFEDDILPAAATPMTAALSIITYGEQKKIVAEFYDKDEWEEQKILAARSLEEVKGNSLEESKVKAAKELVERASKLGNSLGSYLGKTQEDSFDNLIEYVGAGGKYVSITKSVRIYYPKDYLKGVEVVDTPGFNDPIVSREERTKAFLQKADVVLMMLYAGRPFDATDRDILFKNVRQCGIGKVIVGINKYDIPYESGETEEQIKDYVKDELRKACRECDDNTLVEIIKQVEPIPLSAEMALLSELPMSKISGSEAYQHAWKLHCDTFEISSQKEMFVKSHLENLTNAVREIITKEKVEILLAKPMNAILAAGNKKRTDVENELRKYESLISDLEKPDDELDEKYENLDKVNRRLTKKINNLGDDLDSVFHDIVRKGRNDMEDEVDKACKEMNSDIDSLKLFEDPNKSLIPRIEAKLQTLVTRTLKRDVENLAYDAKSKIKRTVGEFLGEAEDILMKYLPDIDSRDFVKKVENSVNLEIENKEVFKWDVSSSDDDYGFWDGVFDFLNGASFGSLKLLTNAFGHGDSVNRLHEIVNGMKAEFDADSYLDTIFAQKDAVIEQVKTAFITELVEPLQKQVEEIKSQKGNKEKKMKEAVEKAEKLKKEKETIEKQFESIHINN